VLTRGHLPGECLLWVGNWIMCSSSFTNAGAHGLATAAIMSLSPAFVTGLITQVSGIPLLEKSSDKKFGVLKAYKEYKSNVPVFFPRLTSWKVGQGKSD
jgi:steroid 5-alpha reductase family enzyme